MDFGLFVHGLRFDCEFKESLLADEKPELSPNPKDELELVALELCKLNDGKGFSYGPEPILYFFTLKNSSRTPLLP